MIIITGMWQCQECGETDYIEPMEDGETVTVEHHCESGNW